MPTRGTSRGGLERGPNGGVHHEFKGVRTRKGVKGFLVEIRPPKWKKTIWLGTYNTSVEAAGAYDAGNVQIYSLSLHLQLNAALFSMLAHINNELAGKSDT